MSRSTSHSWTKLFWRMPGDSRSPVQFTLQSVFLRFVKVAEAKVDALVYSTPSASDNTIDLSQPLKAGVDPEFDSVLRGLGCVGKHCPKLIIDCVMVWRKSKSEKSADEIPTNLSSSFRTKEMEPVIKERKSLVSNFILCRALIEIIRPLSKETLSNELGTKLEEMVFAQLRNIDPELTIRSANRLANVELFSELIGALSNIRFATVSDKFVSEISELTKAGSAKELKLEMVIRSMRLLKLKIYPMECLEDTAEFLNICADFFSNSHSQKIKHAYADLFVELLGPIAAVAQAEVNLPAWMTSIETLFSKAYKMVAKKSHLQVALPMVETLLCASKKEFFLSKWTMIIDLCRQQFRDKQLKSSALNSITRLVWVYLYRCCDPSTINAQRRMMDYLRVLFPTKVRGVVPSEVNLDLFVRLVYIVLVRFTDPTLDILGSLLLGMEGPIFSGPSVSSLPAVGSTSGGPPMSGSILAGESFGLDDMTTKSVISTAGIASGSQLSTINVGDAALNPERLIIALRSFLLLLADIEEALGSGGQSNLGSNYMSAHDAPTAALVSNVGFVVVEGKVKIRQPPFPSSTNLPQGDISHLFEVRARNEGRERELYGSSVSGTTTERMKSPLNSALSDKVVQRMSSSVRDFLDRLNSTLGRVVIALDKMCGSYLWRDVLPAQEPSGVKEASLYTSNGNLMAATGTRRSSFSETSTVDSRSDRPMDSLGVNGRDRAILFDLMKNYIDCIPRLTPSGLTAYRIVEILSRYTLHKEDSVRKSSMQALIRIASIKRNELSELKFWSTLCDSQRQIGISLVSDVVRILGVTISSVVNDRIAGILSIPDSSESALLTGGLGLYLNLLQVWLEELVDFVPTSASRDESENIICEIEGKGLLCLCSIAVAVRRSGVKLLRLATQFERALIQSPLEDLDRVPMPQKGRLSARRNNKLTSILDASLQPGRSRILQILEVSGHELISRHFLQPTVAVGSMRYENQKNQQQYQQSMLRLLGMRDSLIVVCTSDNAQESAIWSRCAAELFQFIYEYGDKRSLKFCLLDVFSRITALHQSIQAASDVPNATKLNASSVRWITGTGTAQSGIPSQISLPVTPATDNVVEQWRQYLHFVCASIESVRSVELKRSEDDIHARVRPKQLFALILPLLSCERNSVRHAVVSALGCVNWRTYQSLIESLQPFMRNVIEDMRLRPSRSQDYIVTSTPTAITTPKKTIVNPAQAAAVINIKRMERMRVEITHILVNLADFLDIYQYRKMESLVKPVFGYIQEILKFLSSSEVTLEWDYHMMRYYFCLLVDRIYDRFAFAASSKDSLEVPDLVKDAPEFNLQLMFPYDLRVAAFKLAEQWCGYGKHAVMFLDRETKSMLSALEPIKDNRERGLLASTMDEQRKVLAMAALRTMATLCRGHFKNDQQQHGDSSISVDFDLEGIFSWLEDMFKSQDEAVHTLALSAIEGLLANNLDLDLLMNHVIKECYVRPPNSPQSITFFTALVNVFCGNSESSDFVTPECSLAAERMLTLALCKSGDPTMQVRKCASRLLKKIEFKLWGDPPHQRGSEAGYSSDDNEAEVTYEMLGINSSLPTMYKYAQMAASTRLAGTRPLFTCEMISEMFFRIEQIGSSSSSCEESIRDLLVLLVPWLKNLQLGQLFDSRIITSGQSQNIFLSISQQSNQALIRSNAILTNLFYITVRYSDLFVTEVENLWVQLVEHRENLSDSDGKISRSPSVQSSLEESEKHRIEQHIDIIVDFLLAIGIRRRNPKFVSHAKKVVVYISRTAGATILVQTIISKISPRSLIPFDTSKLTRYVDAGVPIHDDMYSINLNHILPEMPTRVPFSLGALACVLLVDLAIEIGGVSLLEHLALILHAVFIQLDHFITLICEQMRLLLINLIHSIIPHRLCGSKVEAVLKKLDLREGRRIWPYQDISPSMRDIVSYKQLADLLSDVIDLFAIVDPDLSESWGKIALSFAIGCPVRHAACRSLQILRSLSLHITRDVTGDILNRLSSILGDSIEEIQGFALEMLLTFESMIDNLSGRELLGIPHCFWAGVVCLHSPLEWEFLEGLRIIRKFISEVDIGDEKVKIMLQACFPQKWKGDFCGIQPLLLQGIYSAETERETLEVLNSTLHIHDDSLIGTSPRRALFAFLANLPRLLQAYEPDPSIDGGREVNVTEIHCLEVAEALSSLAQRTSQVSLSRLLSSYAKKRFRTKEDFAHQAVMIIRDSFSPEYESDTLHFIISCLRNRLPFYKKRALRILKLLLPVLRSQASSVSNGPWATGWGSGWNGARGTGNRVLDWTSALGSSELNLEANLINPVLEMLVSDSALEALEVIDEVMAGSVAAMDSSLKVVLFGGLSMRSITKSVRTTTVAELLTLPASSDASQSQSEFLNSGWRSIDRTKAMKTTRYNMAALAALARTFIRSERRGDVRISTRDSPISTIISSSHKSPMEFGSWMNGSANSSIMIETLSDFEQFFGEQSIDGSLSFTDVAGECADDVLSEDVLVYGNHESTYNREKDILDEDAVDNTPTLKRHRSAPSDAISDASFTTENVTSILSRDTSLSSLILDGQSGLSSDLGEEDEEVRNAAVDFFAPEQPYQIIVSESSMTAAPQTKVSCAGAPSPRRNTSASQRLLAQPGSSINITFRLNIPESEFLFSAEAAESLSRDIASALRLSGSFDAVLTRITSDTNSMPLKDRSLATVEFRAASSMDTPVAEFLMPAALAEELEILITGEGGVDDQKERDILLSGKMTSRIDLQFRPEITIDFMGLLVPYIPEGLRYTLPHRKHQVVIRTSFNTPMPSPSVDIIFTGSDRAVQEGSARKLNLNTACEALRIFPTAFELVVQLHEDWLELANEMLNGYIANAVPRERLQDMIESMKSLRSKTSPYVPMLLKIASDHTHECDGIDEAALADAANKMLSMQEAGKSIINDFMERRDRLVIGVNNQISSYLVTRQSFSSDPYPKNVQVDRVIVKRCADVGVALMTLYGMVLALERHFEEFMGRTEQQQPRMDESLRCVHISTHMREILGLFT